MDEIINLELADPNAYKSGFHAEYENIELIDVIFEILGSVKKEKDKLNIGVEINQDNIIIYHNGAPFDKNDIERNLHIATHAMTQNNKGVSKQGKGWRCVAKVHAKENLDRYSENNFSYFSSVISKVKNTISIVGKRSIILNKDEIFSLVHDNDFRVSFKKGNFYDNIYNKYLKDKYGVLFVIPNGHKYEYNDSDIVHKLQLLYNRLDCDIKYKNNMTKCNTRDIFSSKPFYYIDHRIQNNRYLEISCEIFIYNKKKVLIILKVILYRF